MVVVVVVVVVGGLLTFKTDRAHWKWCFSSLFTEKCDVLGLTVGWFTCRVTGPRRHTLLHKVTAYCLDTL